MKRAAFEELVNKLEGPAKKNPGWYAFRVKAMAFLAYFYVSGVTLLLIILAIVSVLGVVSGSFIFLYLAIPVFAFLSGVSKALSVRVPIPDGIEIKPQSCPEFFDLIDEMEDQLDGSAGIYKVFLDNQFNAGVYQVPMLGILGFSRNYLYIGLPMMMALGRDQLKAVLAHELGHVMRGHGRSAHWIYHLRLRLSLLLNTLEERRSWVSFLYLPFLRWFIPYFSALSFPMARQNEYEADSISAKLTSPVQAGTTLSTIAVVGAYLSEVFWPEFYREADQKLSPDEKPYQRLQTRLRSDSLFTEKANGWLEAALKDETTYYDTHPSLRDRLKAMQVDASCELVKDVESSACQLLGATLEESIAHFDTQWFEEINQSWEERHQQVLEGRKALEKYDKKMAQGELLNVDEMLDHACLTEDINHSPEEALVEFRKLYESHPDQSSVAVAYGGRLLRDGNEGGTEIIKKAMAMDSLFRLTGACMLRDFYWQQGNKSLSDQWHDQYTEEERLHRLAAEERNQLESKDHFEPHALPADQLEAVLEALRKIPQLGKVFLVRKQVSQFPQLPCYVLLYSLKFMDRLLGFRTSSKVTQKICETVPLPGGTLIFFRDDMLANLKRRVTRVVTARII